MDRIIFVAVVIVALGVADGLAQANPACQKIKYENNNQIDPRTIELRKIAGNVVYGQNSAPLPGVCVGLFDDETHERILVTSTKSDGSFSVKGVGPGNYRLVVTDEYRAFCAANIPVSVTPTSDRLSSIVVTMRGAGEGGMHACSSGSATVNAEKCNSGSKGGKYKWAGISPLLHEPSSYFGFVLVRPKDVNTVFLPKLAARLRSEYCRAAKLHIVIFDEKRHAGPLSMTDYVDSKGKTVLMRGFYTYDRATGKELLEFSSKLGQPTTENTINFARGSK